jgi:cytochrome c-type biogenesis protein
MAVVMADYALFFSDIPLGNHVIGAGALGIMGLAFVAGVASSISPCVIAMLPVMVGYVGGYAGVSRWVVLRHTILFIVGFALVLTTLGLLATILGTVMGSLVGAWWYYALGLLAMLMGLHLLNVIQIPIPQFARKMPAAAQSGQWIAPLALGAFFGAASSPCGTPFLTAVLAFISQEKDWTVGALSLFLYALGQSALLLVAGLFTGLLKQMAVLRRVGNIITKLSAIVFILAGLRLIALAAGWFDPFAFFP